MENLIFSLNATVPVFLMMLLGMLFRKLGWIDEAFASKMNQFVFLVPLPVLVFHDLAAADIGDVWNFRFVAFCFLVTAASIAICAALSCFLKEKAQRGEFIQASYRSSAALLGIALTTNIYGDAGLVPLMIIGSVPLYNIMAVVVLSLTSPAKDAPKKGLWKSTLKGIVTNPIILGIAAGLLWSVLRLPFPPILEKRFPAWAIWPPRSGSSPWAPPSGWTRLWAKPDLPSPHPSSSLWASASSFFPSLSEWASGRKNLSPSSSCSAPPPR